MAKDKNEQPKTDTPDLAASLLGTEAAKVDASTVTSEAEVAELRKRIAELEAKTAGAVPAAAPSDLPRWICHIPKDPAAPRRTVHAATAGDAERVYKDECGIIASENPISVSGPVSE